MWGMKTSHIKNATREELLEELREAQIAVAENSSVKTLRKQLIAEHKRMFDDFFGAGSFDRHMKDFPEILTQ